MITATCDTHSTFHSPTDFLPCAPPFITRHSSLTVPLAKIQESLYTINEKLDTKPTAH